MSVRMSKSKINIAAALDLHEFNKAVRDSSILNNPFPLDCENSLHNQCEMGDYLEQIIIEALETLTKFRPLNHIYILLVFFTCFSLPNDR